MPGYIQPRLDPRRRLTFGDLGDPGALPAPTTGPATRTPGAPAPAPGMGVGSVTNPNPTPVYTGTQIAPTDAAAPPPINPGTDDRGGIPTDATAPLPIDRGNDDRGTGGGGGLGRAGYADPNGADGHDWTAWRAQHQPGIDRDVGLAASLYRSDPMAAAAILASGGTGHASARDAAAMQALGMTPEVYRQFMQQSVGASGAGYSYDAATGSLYGPNGLMQGPGRSMPGQGGGQGGGAPGAPGASPAAPGGAIGGQSGAGMGSPGYGIDVARFLDPAMAFRMQEGTRAIENSAAARGGLSSGQTLRDLMTFGQGLASTENAAAFDRARNVRDFEYGADVTDRGFDYTVRRDDRNANMATFRDLAQFGLQATGQQQQGANALTMALANILGQAGNINAGGAIGSSNAVNDAIGRIIAMLSGQSAVNAATRP